ncbi:hypothetical protein N9U78_00615 [Flavobacteriaceae bacterium]|nr:hypothetical protein [Flavobacteriaceae bacterium]|tara:strand:+ start:493 stop:1641 length:1149 start_codon:yes stop_codon:yes gene_type:complete
MKKIIGLLNIAILSLLFLGCNAYQLASYYDDSDGIYVSNVRGIDYEVVFSDIADETLNSYSSSENKSQYLPWGANPESTEVVNNFFPNFGSYYLDPYYYNMGFNPYFGYGGYGFSPAFYHNIFGYEMGYPFYRHYSFYFSPFATSPGSYYWYMMRYRRYIPWYYGGMYDSIAYKDQYDNEVSNTSRVSFSNSASRRGERGTSSGVSRNSDSQGTRISGLYSRLSSYGGVYMDRTRGVYDYDDTNRNINLREIKNNDLIGVYSRGSSNSRSINRNSSVPNLSQIKSDYVREAYQQIRSTNPYQRGNSSYRSSSYDYSNSGPSYYNNRSSRNNSSYSNRGGYSSSRSSGSVQGGSFSSSSRGGSISSGSRGSSGGGSRGGGNIN